MQTKIKKMSRLFTIEVIKLKPGNHFYEFEIGNKFFEEFEESEIKEGKLRASVGIERASSHADLTISIEGTVNLTCDRCLEIFSYTVCCTNRLLVKFGSVHDESDPDIIIVQANEHEIDLRRSFYEYILLSLPIRRVHPDDENGKSTCNPLMLEKLKEYIVEDRKTENPEWAKLKELVKN